MKSKHNLIYHIVINIALYSIIFALFYINHTYYYSLYSPIGLIPIKYISALLVILSMTSIIYSNHTHKVTLDLYTNQILINVYSIVYTILLIDLEMILASMIIILMIIYLYVDSILDTTHKPYTIYIHLYTHLIVAIYSAIFNICIVLYNM